jgi:uncharacterized surface protein with fasciclin (FAS1) repeats
MANLFERVQAERKYNQFVKGVQSVVGLVETLNGPGPFTVFVPTADEPQNFIIYTMIGYGVLPSKWLMRMIRGS